jgi:hypothetical protein
VRRGKPTGLTVELKCIDILLFSAGYVLSQNFHFRLNAFDFC